MYIYIYINIYVYVSRNGHAYAFEAGGSNAHSCRSDSVHYSLPPYKCVYISLSISIYICKHAKIHRAVGITISFELDVDIRISLEMEVAVPISL